MIYLVDVVQADKFSSIIGFACVLVPKKCSFKKTNNYPIVWFRFTHPPEIPAPGADNVPAEVPGGLAPGKISGQVSRLQGQDTAKKRLCQKALVCFFKSPAGNRRLLLVYFPAINHRTKKSREIIRPEVSEFSLNLMSSSQRVLLTCAERLPFRNETQLASFQDAPEPASLFPTQTVLRVSRVRNRLRRDLIKIKNLKNRSGR